MRTARPSRSARRRSARCIRRRPQASGADSPIDPKTASPAGGAKRPRVKARAGSIEKRAGSASHSGAYSNTTISLPRTRPQRIRKRRLELAIHSFGGASLGATQERRAGRTPAQRALQSEFAHQSPHRTASHCEPRALDLPDLARAIGLKVLPVTPERRSSMSGGSFCSHRGSRLGSGSRALCSQYVDGAIRKTAQIGSTL